jgi:hypothetical protein
MNFPYRNQKLIELGADLAVSNNTRDVAHTYVYERLNKSIPTGKFKWITKEYEEDVLLQLAL